MSAKKGTIESGYDRWITDAIGFKPGSSDHLLLFYVTGEGERPLARAKIIDAVPRGKVVHSTAALQQPNPPMAKRRPRKLTWLGPYRKNMPTVQTSLGKGGASKTRLLTNGPKPPERSHLRLA